MNDVLNKHRNRPCEPLSEVFSSHVFPVLSPDCTVRNIGKKKSKFSSRVFFFFSFAVFFFSLQLILYYSTKTTPLVVFFVKHRHVIRAKEMPLFPKLVPRVSRCNKPGADSLVGGKAAKWNTEKELLSFFDNIEFVKLRDMMRPQIFGKTLKTKFPMPKNEPFTAIWGWVMDTFRSNSRHTKPAAHDKIF